MISKDIIKRSLSVRGLNTSVTLEREFWEELCRMRDARGISMNALVSQIAAMNQTTNLSSALRVAVVRELQRRLTAPSFRAIA